MKSGKFYILLFVLFICPLAGVGIDIYAPSLPSIATTMHANSSLAKLTIITYLVGYAVTQVIAGVLCDVIGRKTTLLIGSIFYVVITLFTSFSVSIYWLLFMRFFQGVSVAPLTVAARTMVTDNFQGKDLHKATTYMGMVAAGSPILAPFLGGYLEFYFSWKGSFYFLTCYGIIAVVFIAFFKEINSGKQRFDLTEILKSHRSILSSGAFIGYVVCLGLGYGLITISNIISPFLFQRVMGYSSILYGKVALLIGFAMFLGLILNRVLIKHFSSQSLINITLLTSLVFSGGMLLGIVYGILNFWIIMIPSFIITFNLGILIPNCMANCLGLFPENAGIANAVWGFIFVMFSAVIASGTSLFKYQCKYVYVISFAGVLIVAYLVFKIFIQEERIKV